MSNVLLKRCTSCHEYTLQETCPRCGAMAKPPRPAKFSPEDNYGAYRRKLKKLDAAKGTGRSESERLAGARPAAPARPAATESAESGERAKSARPPGSLGSVDSVARPGSKPGRGA